MLLSKLDTLGIEPRAFRMRSGCDTTTPCALYQIASSERHRFVFFMWPHTPLETSLSCFGSPSTLTPRVPKSHPLPAFPGAAKMATLLRRLLAAHGTCHCSLALCKEFDDPKISRTLKSHGPFCDTLRCPAALPPNMRPVRIELTTLGL